MTLKELNEIDVLGDHRSAVRSRTDVNLEISRRQKAQVRQVRCLGCPKVDQPLCQDRRELSVYPNRRECHRRDWLGREDGVIEPARGVPKAGRNVRRFQIGICRENLGRRFPGRQKLEDVNDPNPHPANARPPAALIRVRRNSIEQVGHEHSMAPDQPKDKRAAAPAGERAAC